MLSLLVKRSWAYLSCLLKWVVFTQENEQMTYSLSKMKKMPSKTMWCATTRQWINSIIYTIWPFKYSSLLTWYFWILKTACILQTAFHVQYSIEVCCQYLSNNVPANKWTKDHVWRCYLARSAKTRLIAGTLLPATEADLTVDSSEAAGSCFPFSVRPFNSCCTTPKRVILTQCTWLCFR